MPITARRSRAVSQIKFGAFGLALATCLLAALTLSEQDASAARHFSDAAARWQVNPEFRSIALDYSISGSRAMQLHLFGFIPARQAIMALRSLPGLPASFAVNPTSELHYKLFSQGPLSAYLRLCSEQNLPVYLPLVEQLGRKTNALPELGAGAAEPDCQAFLDRFKMDFPVVHDIGAVNSVAMLVRDADAARPFMVQGDIPQLLQPQIAKVALALNFPTEPGEMNFDQQQVVLERLDAYVHQHDPELWRTKQVNDFCCGIWAQVFGPAYGVVLIPALRVRTFGIVGLFLLLSGTVLVTLRRRAVQTRTDEASNGSPIVAVPGEEAPVGVGS